MPRPPRPATLRAPRRGSMRSWLCSAPPWPCILTKNTAHRKHASETGNRRPQHLNQLGYGSTASSLTSRTHLRASRSSPSVNMASAFQLKRTNKSSKNQKKPCELTTPNASDSHTKRIRQKIRLRFTKGFPRIGS
jgi:hypothetical protein